MKRLLEDLPDRIEWYEYDDENDRGIITTEFKGVGQLLEANKAIQGADVGKVKDDDAPGWWHVARIPNYLIEKWLVEDGLNVFDQNHGPALMRKLDDPEYRFLRVNTGQLGVRKKMI